MSAVLKSPKMFESENLIPYSQAWYERFRDTLGEGPCRQLGIYAIPRESVLSVVIPVYNERATLLDLVERVRKYNPTVNEDLLNRAYVYAMKAHGEQKRASGDPYFSHPLEVHDGEGKFSPHTTGGYAMPPKELAYHLAGGLASKFGYRSALKKGLVRNGEWQRPA